MEVRVPLLRPCPPRAYRRFTMRYAACSTENERCHVLNLSTIPQQPLISSGIGVPVDVRRRPVPATLSSNSDDAADRRMADARNGRDMRGSGRLFKRLVQ